MNLSMSKFHKLSAALTLGALSIGFAPAAGAMATYDATAEFTLMLTSVTDLAGGQPTGAWDVYAIGSDFDNGTLVTGDATAEFSTFVVDPGVALGIGDSVVQTSMSSGTATDGFGESFALTDLGIDVSNFSDQDLRFTFTFDATAVADAVGDAIAFAEVGELDENGDVISLVAALADGLGIGGPPSDADSILGGLIQLDVAAGGFSFLSYTVDTDGYAANSAVPEPATLGLLAAGLMLAGAARRRKSA